MMRPKSLYKYQPFTVEAISNLKNHRIWFSKPAAFNDPYDCAIRIDAGAIPEDDFERLFQRFREKYQEKGLDPAGFDQKYLTHGLVNDLFKDMVRSSIKKAFEDRRQVMLSQRGVSCFSECRDQMLMWSHYARGHRGFCLEFDTSTQAFNRVFQVQYSETIPSVNPASVLLEKSDKAFWSMITVKAACWSYEKEWRIFHMEPDKTYGVGAEALRAVYFGAAMESTHKEIIAMILRDSPTKLYELTIKDTEFRLDCSPFR